MDRILTEATSNDANLPPEIIIACSSSRRALSDGVFNPRFRLTLNPNPSLRNFASPQLETGESDSGNNNRADFVLEFCTHSN